MRDVIYPQDYYFNTLKKLKDVLSILAIEDNIQAYLNSFMPNDEFDQNDSAFKSENYSNKILNFTTKFDDPFRGKLIIKNNGEIIFINIDDIYFIERDSKTVIHTRVKTYETAETIKELERKLKAYSNFFRSHKSFLINLSLIEKVSHWADRSYQIKFIDMDKEALLSRSKVGEFVSFFGLEKFESN